MLLVIWFWTIYLCANDKRDISASQLSKILRIGYESAWYMLKHIRTAYTKYHIPLVLGMVFCI